MFAQVSKIKVILSLKTKALYTPDILFINMKVHFQASHAGNAFYYDITPFCKPDLSLQQQCSQLFSQKCPLTSGPTYRTWEMLGTGNSAPSETAKSSLPCQTRCLQEILAEKVFRRLTRRRRWHHHFREPRQGF